MRITETNRPVKKIFFTGRPKRAILQHAAVYTLYI